MLLILNKITNEIKCKSIANQIHCNPNLTAHKIYKFVWRIQKKKPNPDNLVWILISNFVCVQIQEEWFVTFANHKTEEKSSVKWTAFTKQNGTHVCKIC